MILPEIGGRTHIGFDKVMGHSFFPPERHQAGSCGLWRDHHAATCMSP